MAKIESLGAAPNLEKPVEAVAPLLKVEEVPLWNILPPPEERRVPVHFLPTAGHELNHALLAVALGVKVKKISVIPEGNILGTTTFEGYVSPDKFKIIAAGGAVAPPIGGFPSGYGMDLMQIEMVDLVNGKSGGSSVNFSILQAESILASTYSLQVRKRASEIIAYLGEVSGSQLPAILARAALEVALKSQGKEGVIAQALGIYRPIYEKKPHLDLELTQEQIEKPAYRLVFIEEEGEEKEVVVCALCKGINAHHPDCPLVKRETAFGADLEVDGSF